jgi:IS30 family transposase
MWRRWQAGQSLAQIARGLGRGYSTLHQVVDKCGGIVPAARRRAEHSLTLAHREEISRAICTGLSLAAIAARLGKHRSTVSREIARNGGKEQYRAAAADAAAWERARRPKRCKLAGHRRLCAAVAHGLQRYWSPEQIARDLEQTYPDDHSMRVSHETIYKSLFIQARGVLKKQLLEHLRSRRKLRRAAQASTAGQGRGQIVDAVSISQRPAQVADRAVPGHWEGDLIAGSKNSHIATLVERRSRFVMLVKLSERDTHSVVKALSAKIHKLPAELRRSLTWDRGAEMADHKQFSIATDMQVYFCDPHSPWQRGSNENTNGLLRQFFPKGTDLTVHSQAHLNKVARLMNGRPRETLGWHTPAERFFETVAATY